MVAIAQGIQRVWLPLLKEYRGNVVAIAQGIQCSCHCTGNSQYRESVVATAQGIIEFGCHCTGNNSLVATAQGIIVLLPLYREYRESVVATAQRIRRKCGCHCTGNTELWEYRVSGNSFTLISCLWLPWHRKYRELWEYTESYGNTERVMGI